VGECRPWQEHEVSVVSSSVLVARLGWPGAYRPT
jgi:hypothetical protein